jgi:hypothetical protein
MKRGGSISVSFSMLVLLWACDRTAEEPLTDRNGPTARQPATRRSEPARLDEQPAPDGHWYSLELPDDAAPTLPPVTDVIDWTYVLHDETRVVLTVLRPIPGQGDLAQWIARTDVIFQEDPVLNRRDGVFAGMPAQLQVTDRALRWVFVADGFGAVFLCAAEGPTAEGSLHAACDDTLQSVRLLRPIHD